MRLCKLHKLAINIPNRFVYKLIFLIPRNNYSTNSLVPLPNNSILAPRYYIAQDDASSYKHRLKVGAYHNASDLLSSPFAPHPTQVLKDIIAKHFEYDKYLNSATNQLINNSPRQLFDDIKFLFAVIHSQLYESYSLFNKSGDIFSQLSYQKQYELIEEIRTEVNALLKFKEDTLPNPILENHSIHLLYASMQNSQMNDIYTQCYLIYLIGALNVFSIIGIWDSSVLVYKEIQDKKYDETLKLNLFNVIIFTIEGNHLNYDYSMSTYLQLSKLTIQSCMNERVFSIAIQIFGSILSYLHCTSNSLLNIPSFMNDLVIDLCNTIQTSDDLDEFLLLFRNELDEKTSVSVELYTAIIYACGRAYVNPNAIQISFNLYRTLRDESLLPSIETYNALMNVTARTHSTPNSTFALYHEARSVHNHSSLTPSIFTALIESYINSNLFEDAKKTFDVLMETGVLFNREAFHLLLKGATSQKLFREIIEIMTHDPFNYKPSSTTMRYAVQMEMKRILNMSDNELCTTGSTEVILSLADLHMETLRYHQIQSPLLSKENKSLETMLKLSPAELKSFDSLYLLSIEQVLLNVSLPNTITFLSNTEFQKIVEDNLLLNSKEANEHLVQLSENSVIHHQTLKSIEINNQKKKRKYVIIFLYKSINTSCTNVNE